MTVSLGTASETSRGALTLMRPIRTLCRSQWVPLAPSRTFEFFERPDNLALITPSWLGLRLLTPLPVSMAAGLVLDYRVRVLGVPTHWRSLIAEYNPPCDFRDVQLIGPYRRWDHRHRFRAQDGGTLIEDFVVYEPPLGPLGALLDVTIIRRQLSALFSHRARRIAALLTGAGRSA